MEDLLLATADPIIEFHENQEHKQTNLPALPPGTSSQVVFVNKIGETRFTRIYGMNAAGQAVVVIETRGQKIARQQFLNACRDDTPWHWQVVVDIPNQNPHAKEWHPVDFLPPNAVTRNPRLHQNNKSGETVNAFCTAFRNGNRLVCYDESWTGDPEDVGRSAAPAPSTQSGDFSDYLSELDLWLEKEE